MTQTLFTSRSAVISYQRCKRMRWLEYSEGADGMGLQPAKKSVHPVVGGAVHSGLEVLLRSGQDYLNHLTAEVPECETLAQQLEFMFIESCGAVDGKTVARQIEDRAVAAALADLASEMGATGVELDAEERAGAEAAAAQMAAGGLPGGTEVDFSGMGLGANGRVGGAGTSTGADSPIVIEFDGLIPTTVDPASVVIGLPDPLTPQTSMGAVTVTAPGSMCQSDADYLREELAALVEGMVRAYARRRWRLLLEQFEVLEVEQEGEWKLAEWGGDKPASLQHETWNKFSPQMQRIIGMPAVELHFLSRHDALLLERSTGYLYLQSYKTTGAWDRRKEMDAQVDMQGLSEAVDVERRFAQWWEEIHAACPTCEGSGRVHSPAPWKDEAEMIECEKYDGRGEQPQSLKVWQWGADVTMKTRAIYDYLLRCPSAPTILGVRYEYLLKGSRKKDRRSPDPSAPPRWNQESILCRAWCQEGITADDRRWAWTWDWYENDGRGGRKSRRLDYRSWHKQPVWRSMPIADWIDLLDKFAVQEGAEAEDGSVLDALGEQFVPVVTVYRNADDMRDMLEQTEAQEIQVAQDVDAVRQAAREGGLGAKRSELNRRFPQSRSHCVFPGRCSMYDICYGPPDIRENPEASGLYIARTPNHPAEGTGSVVADPRISELSGE